MIIYIFCFISVICVISGSPLKQEESSVKNKRSAEFIFAGNHQNGARVKKVGPVPAMPPNLHDSNDLTANNDILSDYSNPESVEIPPNSDEVSPIQKSQMDLLKNFLLKQNLEKEENLNENQNEALEDENLNEINENDLDISSDDSNNILSAENGFNTDSEESVENSDKEDNIELDSEENDSKSDSKEPVENTNENPPTERNDYFLHIPGLRSPYKEYPPVAYPLSYAGIPVKKRSVQMDNKLSLEDVVYSDENDNNRHKSYRIKRDLYDDDDEYMTSSQNLPEFPFYPSKRYSALDEPMEPEYYPPSYNDFDAMLRLEEEALLQEAEEKAAEERAAKERAAEERAAKEEANRKFLLMEKILESQSNRLPPPKPAFGDQSDYEVISYKGNVGYFVPIEDQNVIANPSYSLMEDEISKRASFYPIDGDRKWNAFIENELNKRNEQKAYERIYRLAESLKSNNFE